MSFKSRVIIALGVTLVLGPLLGVASWFIMKHIDKHSK